MFFRLSVLHVRPLSEYCSLISPPQKRAPIVEIGKVQKSFTDSCFSRCGILCLSCKNDCLDVMPNHQNSGVRYLADSTLIYKRTTNEINFSLSNLFGASQIIGRLRNHNFRIKPKISNSTAYENSFLVRRVADRNSLHPVLFTHRSLTEFRPVWPSN